MSRNNKNAQRIRAAKEMSALRKSGGKGPSSTTPKHGKKNAWWQIYRSYSEFIKGKGGKKGGAAQHGDVVEVDVEEVANS